MRAPTTLLGALLVALALLVGCGGPETAAPAAGPAPAYSPEPKPHLIEIPKLGVTSNIIDLGLQPNGEMEVPGDTKDPSDPVKDTGWYTSSPSPGRVGATVLAAHVDWKGEDGPFAKLDQLEQGDEVTIESVDGAKAVFVIDRVTTHPKDEFPAEEVYGDTDGPEIRLITCGGEFDAAARSYRDNIVAWGHLKA